MHLPPESELRAAVANRDASWDGRFFYGVVTTGVFCHPSCTAPAARDDNLRFFRDAAAAVQAGYRPCQRCHPDQPSTHQLLIELARYIDANADQPLPLSMLATRCGLSSSRLQRLFKRTFGLSPKAYQDAQRLSRFKQNLRAGSVVTDAIFTAGFGSLSRVYGEANRQLGMPPRIYRGGGGGEQIHYACRRTRLGPTLMAATERGVCFVQFHDDPELLLASLRQEFPNAIIIESCAAHSAELDDWIDALDRHLAGSAPCPQLPLDLRGTAFQILVWNFLCTIPAGEVISYSELAAGIGKPRAVRAAASACAANRIGVLIPCHRVLRHGGGLGGYRWGLERKRALLEAESTFNDAAAQKPA